MSDPVFVYGNWAAYDELSDGIELTEQLAMRQLDELLRLRRAGVKFHAYLMDAFWFARDGGYREWRKPHWPDGPNRWIGACLANDLMPGMWFGGNTLNHLDPAPAWRDSVDAKGYGMCLFEGGFLRDFLDVLDQWYLRGVRVFKFDFMDLRAVPAAMEGKISPEEARTRSVEAFRSALAAFRSRHPEAILLGYNGFEDRECMDRTDRPLGWFNEPFIEPAWLDVFDALYCGDPRPSDVPCLSFWRSVDIYSDHMARAYALSGIPLHRIENCGFMAGNTGTCYWRGKEAWQGMLLLSLARGGRIHVAYGDLSQFTLADANWWARAQFLYETSMMPRQTRDFGGNPGRGEPYGWLSTGTDADLATVVNPSLQPATLRLPSDGDWRVVSHDPSFIPHVTVRSVELAGNQMAVLANGPVRPLVMGPSVMVNPGWYRPAPLDGSDEAPHSSSFKFDGSRAWRSLVVRQVGQDGLAVRTYPTEKHPQPFRVTSSFGSDLPLITYRKVWSGMSWTRVTLPQSDEPYVVTVRSFEPAPVKLQVSLLRREAHD